MAYSWTDSSDVDNSNKDVVVEDPPKGSISSLRCSPTRDMLAVGSWDTHVRVYQHDDKGNTQCLGSKKHDKPVLSLCWDETGQNVFSAGCDCTVRIWNLQKQSFQALGNYHRAPINDVQYMKERSCVITSSWDTNIAFWDLRTSQRSMAITDIKRKIFNMSYKNTLLVCTLNNKHFRWYDVRNLQRNVQDCESNFQSQLRGLDVFPNAEGFAVGSVEGRIQVRYLDKSVQESKGFSFKCHRQEIPNRSSYTSIGKDTHVYSVNVVRFHQQFGTLASGGTDGEVNIWDKDGRARLKHFDGTRLPIVGLDFNRTGQMLAYATSYDYSKGYDRNLLEKERPNIYLHLLKRDDVDPKASKSNN